MLRRIAWVLVVLLAAMPVFAEGPSLVERLGFPADAKVLIVNADDFGMNNATNQGTIQAMQAGAVTSATIMTPAPWFLQAVKAAVKQPKMNIGVHITLTSEWGNFKWSPVIGAFGVPSLVTEQGYFHSDVPMVYLNAKMDEVEREVRAQIDKAMKAGIDITHIDSHMGTMQYAPGYHERYIQIAKDYNLPCRIAGPDLMEQYGGAYLIEKADKLGVLHPEVLYMGDPPSIKATEEFFKARLAGLEPGKVSEIFIHCGQPTPEMKATTATWNRRSVDTEFFRQPETLQYMKDQGIELISYRELRHLQREGKPMPRVENYGWDADE